MDIRIQLLGPVRLVVDGEPVPIGGAGSRGLLAILAVNVNRVITLEHLIDTLWAHDPPASARTIVHGNVSALRRALRKAHEHGPHPGADPDAAIRVETTAHGYRLAAEPDLVDVRRAGSLLEQARSLPAGRRAELLHEALALWQGPALGDAPPSVSRADLRELWRSVHGARVDADLELGRYAELIVELTGLVEDDPAVERTVAQLMRALYYAGRRGDALEVYRSSARHISSELGIDPGPELMALHEQVLHDDMPPQRGRRRPGAAEHDTALPGGFALPTQLPAAVPNLAGRQSELAWLDAMRVAAGQGVATIGVLTGTAGVGKSALMVAWAHRVVSEFPDGVLFAALHGADAGQAPLAPGDALNQFLRGLGVPAAELPEAVRERVALYRSLLAERRMLVLLDDAANPEQVEPLLPPGGECMTVVTSRTRMDDLAVSHAARHRVLGTLAPPEALRLVEEVAGPDSRGRSARVAELCGYLPLALRLAGARLAAGAQWSTDDLVYELADERTRLSALDVAGADTSVRAALDVSYRGLPAELAATFRRLGVLNVDSVGPHHLAELCFVDVPTARKRLRVLAAQNLLTESARDTFTAHDLVRLYARELAATRIANVERDAVVDASLRFYLAACDSARRKLLRIVDPLDFGASLPPGGLPVLAGSDDAAAWFEHEWHNVMTTLDLGLAAGRYEQVWQLARVAHTYRVVHPWWDQWSKLIELGLRAAEEAGSDAGRYWMRISRCSAGLLFDLAERSRVDGEEALRLATELGEDRMAISASIHLGCALLLCERYDESIATLHKVLVDTERLGDPSLHGQALNNCAEAEKRAGRFDDAIGHQNEALEIDRALADRSYIVVSLNNLAEMHLATGELDTAQRYARESIELASAHGFTLQEGMSRLTLGRILGAAGAHERAYDQLSMSLDLHERVGAREAAAVREELDSLSRPRDLADT